MYDLIGDIHGYHEHLTALLKKLGYTMRHGLWSHPTRKVIFLGDFVDRGKGQIETVNIVRNMTQQGHALAVMGNHEFNAVCYATPDPRNAGEFLRARTQNNVRQHAAFINAVGEGSSLHEEFTLWFKTLPLFLELDALRVVHACWHEPSLNVLKEKYLDSNNCLKQEAWLHASSKGHDAFEAVEVILKGMEIKLPDGVSFLDKGGHPRRHIRSRWWQSGATTYKATAIVPADAIEAMPDESIKPDLLPGYDGKKPLFLGHYWLQSDKPTPLTEHIACLDYSVANEHVDENNRHGKLVAYRWDGEDVLTANNFVWVS